MDAPYTPRLPAKKYFSRLRFKEDSLFMMFYCVRVGIFFVYDLSQFMVEVVDNAQTFSRFLVNVCAIVGGVFTITGVLDSIIHFFQTQRK